MNTDWTLLSEAKDEEIPLFRASLLIARDEYPELDTAYYDDLCEGWSRAIAPSVRSCARSASRPNRNVRAKA